MTAAALPSSADVVIVGAGTAGAACAAACAYRGLRVVCIDRQPLDEAGARWVNGVPRWSFERSGFSAPVGEELLGGNDALHLFAGRGPERITIRDHGVLAVDMRLLVARLQSMALERGALLHGAVAARGMENGDLVTDHGRIRARWFVNAAGLSGPSLLPRPRIAPKDLCTAAQEVREVADRHGALAFFERHRVPLGETLCFSGVAGGYSILNVRSDGDRVSILTGSIPGGGRASGQQIVDVFVAEEPWIGRSIFGGARAVPIRRPFDRLASERVALLGDAASQVFPAHGSGIGPGLIAATRLADALASGAGPEAYAKTIQRELGPLLGAYDVFRRFSQTLTAEQIARLMQSGVMDPELARAGLAQQFPQPSPIAVMKRLSAATREPKLVARLAATIVRMGAVSALYAVYPTRADYLRHWSHAVGRVFQETPDADLVS